MAVLVESQNPLCWVVLSSPNALDLGPRGNLGSEAETSLHPDWGQAAGRKEQGQGPSPLSYSEVL